jgi:protein SCO1/2
MRQIRRSHSGIGLLALLLPIISIAAEVSAEPHARHRQSMQSNVVSVETASYAIPNVTLTNEDGMQVRLREVLASDRPLAVNFIFTSCTTICPVMTATMLQLQGQLVDDAKSPLYVSISIDPDFDTAAVMKSYAAKYGADWTFLTGSQNDVMLVLQSFDAYRGSKINHFALTLLHAGDAAEWTRIEGLTSASELARIWRQIGS